MGNALSNGQILQNEYEILSVLGQGGFGITYLARDISLKYKVVIKEFLPQDMASRQSDGVTVAAYTKDTQSYEHLLKRFSEEAQLLAKMRHPNIVKVIRFFRANNTAYFVMEYAEGETLKAYLARKGTMSEEEILSVMMPILEGTKYIHEQGFLHRDIAPDNIYLKKDGMPILIDFGAARDAIAEESKNISSIVKEGYSAPEQYTVNNKQNASADIYALGAVFYRMITGKVPSGAAHRQTAMLNNDPDPIGDFTETYKGKYSQKLLHAVKKALHIRATDRFSSVSEFQKALLGDAVIDSDPGPISKPGKEDTGQSAGNSRTGLVAAFITIIILLVSGIIYILMDMDSSKSSSPMAGIVSKSNIKESSQTETPTAIESQSIAHNDESDTSKAQKRELEKQKQKEEAERLKREREELEKQKLAQEAERLKREREEIERLKAEQRAEAERLRREKEEKERAEEEARRAAEEAKKRAAATPKCTPYRVNTIQLNVRDQPGVPSNILGRVSQGDQVCVYSFSGKWARTNRGWISGKYLVPTGSTGAASNTTASASQEQTINFEENGISIAVSYPRNVRAGESFLIKAVMVNKHAKARMGGLTLSFPDMISMSGEGLYSNFSSLKGYTPPSKLYSSITGGNIYSKYYVIEGWQDGGWPYGTAKGFSVRLTAPNGIQNLRVNVRGVLHIGKSKRKKREAIIPTYSSTRDQQGYYTKQFNIAIN